MAGFAPLNAHSEFTLRDGCMTVEQYLDRLAELDLKAAALTDTHNLFAAFKFHQQAFRRGIKPILGSELFVGAKAPHRRRSSFPRLRVLVETQAGYSNLCQLISESYRTRDSGGLFVPRSRLAEMCEGLFVLGPEASGPGSPPLDLSVPDFVKNLKQDLQLYGDRYYVEIPLYGPLTPDQKEYLRYADEKDVSVLFTHPAYYPTPEDADVLPLRLAVQTNTKLEQLDELAPHRRQQHVVGANQMREWLGKEAERLELTEKLARRCSFEFRTGTHQLPVYPGAGQAGSAAHLKELCQQALKQKDYASEEDTAVERMEMELQVITSRGFSDYFLIVADIVNWAREQGIAVGPGRGSAAGSFVAYLLGITEVDPFAHDLIFERFLNHEREEMPDIDLDFADRRRDEVINYVRQRFGEQSVAQIITFGRLKARNSLRAVGRVRGEPRQRIDRLLGLFPVDVDLPLAQLPARFEGLEKALNEADHFKQWYAQAKKLEGLVRNASLHAAGLLIGEGELSGQLPLYRPSEDGQVASQYDMYDLTQLGYLKLDILGLTTLTLLELTLEKLPPGEEVDLSALPETDSQVSDWLKERSLEGIFQFETTGCRDLVQRLQPEDRRDLMDCLALYRPGPLQSGIVDSYLKRRRGEEEVEYPHPNLESILESTYGLIIYQEQVMAIARRVAGFSWARADTFREAMGKKKADLMASLREEFVSGARENGYEPDWAKQLFETLSNFAEYGFNRSHSAAYAAITFRTAYLKAHYSRYFYAALCTVKAGDRDRIGRIAGALQEDGFRLLPPRVNCSEAEFTVAEEGVRYGLMAVKHVSAKLAQEITDLQQGEEFADLNDFLSRVDPSLLHRQAFQSLAASGYFDPFVEDRGGLVKRAEELIKQGGRTYRERERGQENLFGEGGGPLEELAAAGSLSWTFQQRTHAQKEALGYYPSGHPLQSFSHFFPFMTPGRPRDFVEKDFQPGQSVAPPQLLALCEEVYSQAETRYLKLLGEDEELVLRSDETGEGLVRRVLLCELAHDSEGWKIVKTEIVPRQSAAGLIIHLTSHQRMDQIKKLKQLLTGFSGESPVRLHIHEASEVSRLEIAPRVNLQPELARALDNLLGPGHTALFFPSDSQND